jgi:hypothetical protein
MATTRKSLHKTKMHWPDLRTSPKTWATLNLVFRYGIGVASFVTAAILVWFDADAWWFWGPLAVFGVILLMFTGSRDDFLSSQKKPWH